jgi:hypothetical protein
MSGLEEVNSEEDDKEILVTLDKYEEVERKRQMTSSKEGICTSYI